MVCNDQFNTKGVLSTIVIGSSAMALGIAAVSTIWLLLSPLLEPLLLLLRLARTF